jgi:hypothetical protein
MPSPQSRPLKKGCPARPALLVRRLTRTSLWSKRQSGRSSGVEHNLAKVGVEGSNPFARSKFCDAWSLTTNTNAVRFGL